MERIPRYGVLEQTPATSDITPHIEQIRLEGWTIIPSTIGQSDIIAMREALLACLNQQAESIGGSDALEEIGEADTVRAPLVQNDAFLRLALEPAILEIVGQLLGDYFILSQQNGIVSQPHNNHNQAAYHRDLPYQHFVTSRPIAVNALFCLDEFTAKSGSTRLLKGTHQSEAFPSDRYISRMEMASEVPAGSFLVFDSMIYHRGGANLGNEARCAVNNMYSIPIIKQQISLPHALAGKWSDDPALAKLLGYESEPSVSISDYYLGRRARLSQ